MKNSKFILIIILAIGVSVYIFRDFIFSKEEVSNSIVEEINIEEMKVSSENKEIQEAPLNRVSERITKKDFGDFITPQSSPVQPERFSGYHTGIDLEIFEDEINIDIPIKTICRGNLIFKKVVSGYGGVVIQKCELNEELVTVIYGHLDIESVNFKIDKEIEVGEIIGKLGKGNSIETDYERKHLHLGIHKGKDINLNGYVQNKIELNDWIDPCLYVCVK